MIGQVLFWYVPERTENLHPLKNLHMDVTAALFIIAKTGKQLKCHSLCRWMAKQIMGLPRWL